MLCVSCAQNYGYIRLFRAHASTPPKTGICTSSRIAAISSRRASATVTRSQCSRQTFCTLGVSNKGAETTEEVEDTMGELNMKRAPDASLSLFDDQGALVGTIHRPVLNDPVGRGLETVYLARECERQVATAAA